jgi:glutaredoxin
MYPTVTFFHTVDCHLCEEVLTMLERLRRRLPFDLTLVDISDDPEAYRRYCHAIPVVWVDGHEVGRYPISETALIAALRAAASRP